MPAIPLIPLEPEEWNPDPFRFLYAAMGLLSFSFQGIMSKKFKIFTCGRNLKRNQILSSIPPHRMTPERKLNSHLQKVGAGGTATGFQTGLEPPPSCDTGNACGALSKIVLGDLGTVHTNTSAHDYNCSLEVL